jgi:hypothetical protein
MFLNKSDAYQNISIMKFSLNLLLIIGLFPIYSIAQSHYKQGYLVKSNGDTIHGYIDYRAWDLNPTSIKFKLPKEGKVETFNIYDLDSFGIDHITSYKKYTVMISMNDINPDHMTEFRDTSFRIATVFLKLLQKGENLILYSYSDGIKERFYLGETPKYEPVELIYRLYYDLNAVTLDHGRTVNENTYMKQLYTMAMKYTNMSVSLQRDIEDADYQEYKLFKIVKKINNLSK